MRWAIMRDVPGPVARKSPDEDDADEDDEEEEEEASK